jgi:ABC-type Fe3+ transport system permease subunit
MKWLKSWFILALCRFGMGICIYFLLFNLIFENFKNIFMEHGHEHTSTVKREIPKANTGHIWRTFWILLAITVVEVAVGMFHLLPKGTMLNAFFIVLR